MHFNKHSELKGKHAFMSASKFGWINASPSEIVHKYENYLAVQRGTELHEFAANAISLGIKLGRTKQSLYQYVNDCINDHMTPEQILYYSGNCFGTADAIRYDEVTKTLGIYDLKTGATPAHFEQLEIYAALFCLEYNLDPHELSCELRIYQNAEVHVEEPDPDAIFELMGIIVEFDSIIDEYKAKEGL